MFVWKRRDRRMDESRVVLKYNEGIPAMNKETEVEIIKKFIVKNKQERIIWKLQNAKKRKKVFWHFDHPDIFKKEILYPSTYKDAEHLEKVLYEMSGTRECYVIGECSIGTMQLRQACEEAWQGGICIIYCGNGIGYYQGEQEYGAPPRFLLHAL